MSLDYQRLEKTLSREFRQYHVTAQVYRVTLVFLGALALQLKDGWHDWTFKGLYALGVAAAVATLRHFTPTVSWKLILDHLHAMQAVAEQKDAAGGATDRAPIPPPLSAQVYSPVTTPSNFEGEHGPEFTAFTKPGKVIPIPKAPGDTTPPTAR